METKKFLLHRDHLLLLRRLHFNISYHPGEDVEAMPDINHKRLFGNTTSWIEVAEILGLQPSKIYTHAELLAGKDDDEGFPYGYSTAQILTCKLRIVELATAMEVIFKYGTVSVGTEYEVDKYGSYFHLISARNYIYLQPVIKYIEKLSDMDNIPQLHELACNLHCETDDPYGELHKQMVLLTRGAKDLPLWVEITCRELLRLSNAKWSPLSGRVPTATEVPNTN